MDWISVEDKLPDKDGFYNVIVETYLGRQAHSFWWKDNNWHFDYYLGAGEPLFAAERYADITHWQSLPTSHNSQLDRNVSSVENIINNIGDANSETTPGMAQIGILNPQPANHGY